MRDSKFLYKSGREHARRECTPENSAELLIQTTDAHVLELEVGRKDSIRGSPAFRRRERATYRQRAASYFLALDLILIELSAALMKVTSVFSIKMP